MNYKIIVFVLMQSLLTSFSLNASTVYQRTVPPDTLISNYLSDVNADSIKSTIQHLQDFGTRFMFAPNRREIAVWLKNKFISIGYPNTVIDSFMVEKLWNGITYKMMQYNVIATLQGVINPEDIYVMGGHYDSFTTPEDPMINAPGADDNASGTAASIEVARVMKKNNYQPAFTIKFVAFAAEELMMSPGGCGSSYYVSQAEATGQNIRLMINYDMISHATTSGNWMLNLNRYDNSAWASNLAQYIIPNYTNLSFQLGWMNEWTDSRPFWEAGFCAVWFGEAEFSPYYHQLSDIISNYNMPYCAEIAKVGFGMLLHLSQNTEVQNLQADPSGNNIRISWNKSKESNAVGYNIYRSINPSGGFTKLNSTIMNLNDTVYIDPSPTPLIEYFYAAVNTSGAMPNEAMCFRYDSAMILTLNQGILIVDDSQLEYLMPADSVVDHFYDSLLLAYHPHQYDVINSGAIKLSEIGKYSTVLWHTDKYVITSKFFDSQNVLKHYLKSGGNLLLTVDRFIATTTHKNPSSLGFNPGSFVYDYLQCDSVYKNNSSLFSRAKSLSSGYPSMETDTLKTSHSLNHHLSTVESIYKRNGANNIYSYDSQYDSISLPGTMNDLPVGYEYIGNDYKMIALSFPLWYMRYDDVKAFVNYAMQNIFEEPLSIAEINSNSSKTALFPCFPNPFSETTSMKYYLSESGIVNLGIYDITGKIVAELVNKSQSSGAYTYTLNSANLNNGLYFCTLKTSKSSVTTKLVLVK